MAQQGHTGDTAHGPPPSKCGQGCGSQIGGWGDALPTQSTPGAKAEAGTGQQEGGCRPVSENTPPAVQRQPGSWRANASQRPKAQPKSCPLPAPDHLPSHRTTPAAPHHHPQTQEEARPSLLAPISCRLCWGGGTPGKDPLPQPPACFWRRLIREALLHAQGPGRAAGNRTWTASEGSLCPQRGPCSQATRPHQLCAHKPQSNPSFPVTSEDACGHSCTAGPGRLRSLPVSTNPVSISKLSKLPKAPHAPNTSVQGPSTPSGPHQLRQGACSSLDTRANPGEAPAQPAAALPRVPSVVSGNPNTQQGQPRPEGGQPPCPTWQAPVFPMWLGKHSDAPGALGGPHTKEPPRDPPGPVPWTQQYSTLHSGPTASPCVPWARAGPGALCTSSWSLPARPDPSPAHPRAARKTNPGQEMDGPEAGPTCSGEGGRPRCSPGKPRSPSQGALLTVRS